MSEFSGNCVMREEIYVWKFTKISGNEIFTGFRYLKVLMGLLHFLYRKAKCKVQESA